MAKAKTIYACQSCGFQSPKWLGKCPDCNQWNSLVEERIERFETEAAGLATREIVPAAPLEGVTQRMG